VLHSLVWLRVAEAEKNDKKKVELLNQAMGLVEAANIAMGPLIQGLATVAKEQGIARVYNKAIAYIDITKELEKYVKNSLDRAILERKKK